MNDATAASGFVKHVLDIGRDTAGALKSGVATVSGKTLTFDDSDDTSLSISLMLLGFSLASLRGHSPIMTSDRAAQIADHCKAVFLTQFDLPPETARQIVGQIDGFAHFFETSLSSKDNPIAKASVPLLRRCLGADFDKITMMGGTAVSPLIGDTATDLLTISLTQALLFWKHYCKSEGN